MSANDDVVLENTQDWKDLLAHPDPDVDLLPAVLPPELVQQEQTAAHLLRASVRLDAAIEATTTRMEEDLEAWRRALAKLQGKREAWRTIVKEWMQRNGVTQIKTPWFTASIAKGRTRIVVDDEPGAIAAVKAAGGHKAVKVVEKLVKAEFDAIFNAIPKTFEGVAHEETGEPSLMVRKAKE